MAMEPRLTSAVMMKMIEGEMVDRELFSTADAPYNIVS